MNNDNTVILQYLRSIEGKIDTLAESVQRTTDDHDERISDIEMERSEEGGMRRAYLVCAGGLSAFVTFIINVAFK